jgi:hypothetical protein
MAVRESSDVLRLVSGHRPCDVHSVFTHDEVAFSSGQVGANRSLPCIDVSFDPVTELKVRSACPIRVLLESAFDCVFLSGASG